jgi:hypothetical protein
MTRLRRASVTRDVRRRVRRVRKLRVNREERPGKSAS